MRLITSSYITRYITFYASKNIKNAKNNHINNNFPIIVYILYESCENSKYFETTNHKS